MNRNDIITILLVILGLGGIVVFIIFLAGLAIFESFYLIAGIIIVIIAFFVAVHFQNKNRE